MLGLIWSLGAAVLDLLPLVAGLFQVVLAVSAQEEIRSMPRAVQEAQLHPLLPLLWAQEEDRRVRR